MSRPARDTLTRPPPSRPTPGPGLALDAWGAVFCGGASRRMGRDKALLELDGEPLVRRAARVLGAVVPRVLLASGCESRYPELGLECVLDCEPGAGPLAGLAAVLARLERAPVAYACVLACDLPYADGDVFRLLLECARESGAELVLPESEKGLEPLCAVVHRAALPAVRAALDAGARRMDSFHECVRMVRVRAEAFQPGPNLNTREDFLAAGGRWA
ncbi:MAG: molybdenum cofactor guanylyltransferase [Planctomycetes bacterium]|nr:molybdenum cofactor guanylyltransferase [Planctomycetota bacterium]